MRILPPLLIPVLAPTLLLLAACRPPEPPASPTVAPTTLRVLCAAGVRKEVAAAAKDYEAVHRDIHLDIEGGGSGALYGQLKTGVAAGMPADLFISADDALIAKGQTEGLIADPRHLVSQRAVLGLRLNAAQVAPAAPKDLPALAGGAWRYGIAKESAAIGAATRKVAEKAGCWEAVKKGAAVETDNVVELAAAVKTGALDAGIMWDATVRQSGLGMARLPELDAVQGRITSACVVASPRRAQAAAFLADLADPAKGGTRLREASYTGPATGVAETDAATQEAQVQP